MRPPGHGAFWGEVMAKHPQVARLRRHHHQRRASATFRKSRRASRCWPARSRPRTLTCTSSITASTSTSTAWRCKSGDLIHADQHGAVVVPLDKIDAMKPAFETLSQREAKIIAAAQGEQRRRGDQGGVQGLTQDRERHILVEINARSHLFTRGSHVQKRRSPFLAAGARASHPLWREVRAGHRRARGRQFRL